MGETTALVPTNGNGAAARYTEEERQVIRKQFAPDLSDQEFALFLGICRHRRLDPFKGQVHCFRTKGERGRLVIMPSIEGLAAKADETGQWGGLDGPYWCGADGEWRDVWLSADPPAACKVGVYRRGWPKPAWGIALFREYNRAELDTWRQRPAHMLSIVAARNAFRRAGFSEFAGGDDLAEGAPIVVDEATGEILEPQPPARAPERKPAAAKANGNGDAAKLHAANERLAAAFRGAGADPKDVDLVSRIVLAGLSRQLDDTKSLDARDRERLAKWIEGHADAVSGIQVDLQREREAEGATDNPFEEGAAEEAPYEPDAGDLKLTGAQERAREAVVKAETVGSYAQQQGL
jgi:phage recombination protein Bet